MINKKNIIILVSIIVVLIIATVLVVSLDNSKSQTESNTQTQVQPVGEVISIFKGDLNALTKIEVVLPDENLKFSKDGDGGWSMEGMENDKVKRYKISSLASGVSSVSAKSLVEENAQDLTKYGLENPQHMILAEFGSDVVKMYCGDITTANDSYYFRVDGSNNVYTIYSVTYESLFSNSESYRAMPSVAVTTETVCGVKIERDDMTINLQLMETPITVNSTNYATWEMTSPSYHTIDNTRLSTHIMDKLPYVTIDGAVSDAKNYSDYGLDNPYAVITITNTDDTKQIFKISPYGTDKYYVLVNHDTTVYYSYYDRFSFVDVKPFDLVNKFISFYSFNDFSTVTVNTDSATYTASITTSGDTKKYTVNNKELQEHDFNVNIFQNIIGLLATDLCNDAVYAEPEVVIEYIMTDGSKSKAEFVSYDERNYAVFKDGKCDFMILKKEVKSLIDVLERYSK